MTFLQAFSGIRPSQPTPELIKISGKAINKKLHDTILMQYALEMNYLPLAHRISAIQNPSLEGNLKREALHKYAQLMKVKFISQPPQGVLEMFQEIKSLCSIKIDGQPEATFSPELFRDSFKGMILEAENKALSFKILPIAGLQMHAQDPAIYEMLGLYYTILIKTQEDFVAFCSNPQHVTKITLFYKMENPTDFMNALKGNTSLRQLHLSGQKIGNDGAIALAEALKENTSLEQLTLSENLIDDTGAVALARLFKANTSLNRLILSNNTIGDIGATALAEAFRENTSLTNLDLRHNLIGDIGITAFAETFQGGNTTLTNLDLYHNLIGDIGTTALAEAFQGNTTLTFLILGDNHIGDQGTIELAKIIEANKSLTTLLLDGNNIQDAGAIAIAHSLENNTSLNQLNLSQNEIGNTAALPLARALAENQTLKRVFLIGNRFEGPGRQALKAAEATRHLKYIEL